MTKRKANPKKGGRPRSVMTPDTIEAILRHVRLGIWPDRAATMHGINASTMRTHKDEHPEFRTALEKAEAEAESSVHGKILRHMETQWTACAWMLERRWPQRWAKREAEVQVNIDNRPAPKMGPDEDEDWPTYFEKLAEVTRSIKATNGQATR